MAEDIKAVIIITTIVVILSFFLSFEGSSNFNWNNSYEPDVCEIYGC